MVSVQQVESIAMGFAEVTASPHFHKVSYRVRKKIFATMDEPKRELVVKLTVEEQDIFCTNPKRSIIPVSGAWGKKGWTLACIDLMDLDLLQSLLKAAYITVAPKSIAQKYLNS